MKSAAALIWNLVPLAVASAAVLWVLYRWLKKSDEPLALVGRWVVSLVLAAIALGVAVRTHDEFSKIFAVLVGAVCGLGFAILWGPSFCGWVAKQFTGLYDGGDLEVEPAPMYSIAEARRKQGRYAEALAEVRLQIEKFPDDFPGWMLLAEIQAENLHDLTGAAQTIEDVVGQEGRLPKNIAYALSRLADWQLKLRQDRAAARAALERIVQLFPDTEQAQLALQRIAHLTPEQMMIERHEPRRVQLTHHEENLGLRGETSAPGGPASDEPSLRAAALVKHLEQHPQDYEAREELASIYADRFQRLDLAADQLEQLIAVPYQPAKQVAHWLNSLADLQIKLTGDATVAKATLQRIVERFPKTAAAESALKRIAHLNLEVRSKQKGQAVKLGTYEQNLGLKGKPSSAADPGQSASQSR
ncbi:MAG: tetratricopeptide repeat protein [Verrucomicrobia bacterium]|nr:tetratricopeptide repeat protein [Verrucomicrobiota bacterium]